MKNLLIMRHAKSAYPADVADDFDRPLNKRGSKDVPLMADLLRSFGPTPECILSSPAARARETAEGMISGLGAADEILLFDERLYLADPATLTRATGELPDSYGTLLVIAHNPGLEQWIARLCGCSLRLPTAGLAMLQFGAHPWSALQSVRCQLQWFVLPRLVRAITQ